MLCGGGKVGGGPKGKEMKGLRSFEFLPDGDEKLLSGRGTAETANLYEKIRSDIRRSVQVVDKQGVADDDAFQMMGLVCMKNTSNKEHKDICFPDSRMCSGKFLVKSGQLKAKDSGGENFKAYEIHPAQEPPKKYQGSDTGVYLKFPSAGSWRVYTWDGLNFRCRDTLTAKNSNKWNRTSILVEKLRSPLVVLAVEADQPVSVWWPLSAAVDGAELWSDTHWNLSAKRFSLDAIKVDATKTWEGGRLLEARAFPFDPELDWCLNISHFHFKWTTTKKFYPVQMAGREGVVWQRVGYTKDPEGEETDYEKRCLSTLEIYLTWLTPEDQGPETIKLPMKKRAVLVGATCNGKDALVYLTVAPRRPKLMEDQVTPTAVWLTKVNASGAEVLNRKMDASKSGMDVWKVSPSGSSMAWNTATDRIGIMFSRTFGVSSDGINHQGVSAFTVDAKTLDELQNHKIVSSHSFGNTLTVLSDGWFLGMEVGDAKPRGISVTRFTADGGTRQQKSVFATKRKHGRKPTSKEFPKYEEVSTKEKPRYKWSNDNATYAELAHLGLHEAEDGSLVAVFAGEGGPGVDSLDNKLAVDDHNCSRNIGFVRFSSDMKNEDVFTGDGKTYEGGYYSGTGKWIRTSYKGIVWLTEFTDIEENATRVKTARIGPNLVMILFEVWSTTGYVNTRVMEVDLDGKIVRREVLGFPLRLAPNDEAHLDLESGSVVFYSGSRDGPRLIRYELKPKAFNKEYVKGVISRPHQTPTLKAGKKKKDAVSSDEEKAPAEKEKKKKKEKKGKKEKKKK